MLTSHCHSLSLRPLHMTLLSVVPFLFSCILLSFFHLIALAQQPVPWPAPAPPSPALLPNCNQNASGLYPPCSQQPINCSSCDTTNGFFIWCENNQTYAYGTCPTGQCDGFKTGCKCPEGICQNCTNPSQCSLQGRCDRRGFCICDPGFSGNNCEQTNPCTGKSDGPHCVGLDRIICQNQYQIGSNQRCTLSCVDNFGCRCPNSCTSPLNGQCQPTTTPGECNCNPGFIDDDCSLEISTLTFHILSRQILDFGTSTQMELVFSNCTLGASCGQVQWLAQQCSGPLIYSGTVTLSSNASTEFAGKTAMLFNFTMTCGAGCLGQAPTSGTIKVLRVGSGILSQPTWGMFLNDDETTNRFGQGNYTYSFDSRCSPPSPPPTRRSDAFLLSSSFFNFVVTVVLCYFMLSLVS